MLRWSLVLAIAGSCSLNTAFAQEDAAAYCKALSDSYLQKAMQADRPTGQIPMAIAKCATDPAASIEILQKALLDAKLPLPSRT